MKVAIVNAVAAAVETLRAILASVPEYQLIWVAAAGSEALFRSRKEPPDIMLLDLMLPSGDGVEITQQIMAESPCAILIVTPNVRGNADKVFEAMGHGALDAIDTPALQPGGPPDSATNLLAKLATLARLVDKNSPTARSPACPDSAIRVPPMVAIGASSGGPHALAAILSRLPTNLCATVVIVEHVDVQFAPQLVGWLGQTSPLPVRLALEGARPRVGQVLVAGTNDHLVLRQNLTLQYTPEPRRYPYRPSVNAFFESVAAHWPGVGVGVLLTGMGADGAEGLMKLRAKGWHTIAQDQESSAIYGMPRAAAEMGAAVQVLPVDEIALAIVAAVTPKERP